MLPRYVKRCQRGRYFLRQLKRVNVESIDLVIFYTTCIHPITENVCAVFHNGLPVYLSDELECLQKRALRIIYRYVTYRDASSDANLGSLANRRSAITAKLLADIISKQDHKLRHLLPPPNKCAEYLLSFECPYVKQMNKELLHKSYCIADRRILIIDLCAKRYRSIAMRILITVLHVLSSYLLFSKVLRFITLSIYLFSFF